MTTVLNEIDKVMILNELSAMDAVAFTSIWDVNDDVGHAVAHLTRLVMTEALLTNDMVKDATYDITRAVKTVQKAHADSKQDGSLIAFVNCIKSCNHGIVDIIGTPNHTVGQMLYHYGLARGHKGD